MLYLQLVEEYWMIKRGIQNCLVGCKREVAIICFLQYKLFSQNLIFY